MEKGSDNTFGEIQVDTITERDKQSLPEVPRYVWAHKVCEYATYFRWGNDLMEIAS